MKLVISSAANRDLESIRQYSIERVPHNTVALMDAILDHCASIGDAPLRFPLVPSRVRSGLRRRRFAPYLIFFVISDDRIEIVRILHERMDYMRLIAFDQLQDRST